MGGREAGKEGQREGWEREGAGKQMKRKLGQARCWRTKTMTTDIIEENILALETEVLGRLMQKATLREQCSHLIRKICERFESTDKQIIFKTAKIKPKSYVLY